MQENEITTPTLNFIKTYNAYTQQQRDMVVNHGKLATSHLPINSSSFLKAAAINYYVYNFITKTAWAGGNSAFVVLSAAKANCGGMVVAMAELLYSQGISSRLAYGIGDVPAHSMIEVTLGKDKYGLFDPFIGAVYLDKETKEPISIFDIKAKMQANEVSVYFAHKTRDASGSFPPMTKFENAYTFEDIKDRQVYPDRIVQYKTLNVQNSNCLDVIDITLTPGLLIGHKKFKPKPSDPKPWTKLGTYTFVEKSKPNEKKFLSWAYRLGYVDVGYRIQHMYYLKDLIKGKAYKLKLYIIAGYKSPWEFWLKENSAKITIKQVQPCGEIFNYSIVNRTFDCENLKPQEVSLTFTAQSKEMCFLGHGAGNILLCGIGLEKELLN